MRNLFADILTERMADDKDIWIVTGDLGYGLWDKVRDTYPDRFINTGAAEQAMMGIGVGLAQEGKKPFVYSITTFLLYRPFETIRNYINKENIPVRLVGSGRNDDYSHDGFSHDSSDAKDVLDLFDNINQYWPDKESEIDNIVDRMVNEDKPSFVSLRR